VFGNQGNLMSIRLLKQDFFGPGWRIWTYWNTGIEVEAGSSNHGSTRTDAEHQILRGLGLSYQTGPQVQAG